MALVNVTEVSLRDQRSSLLLGGYIDVPITASQTDVYALHIAGWVLGRSSPAVAVEVIHDDAMLRRVPVRIDRPDVAAAYPGIPEARNSGFEATVGLLETTLEYELLVRAVLQDDSRAPIGLIRGQRHPLRSDFQPELQPLMVTSLGRTGTTWLMRLLAEHSSIVAHKRYPYELRSARYWMHMVRVLSEPANHFQSANFDDFYTDRWCIGHNPFYSRPIIDDPQLHQWFGRVYVERLTGFCQRSIEECYRRIATSQRQLEPVYFAEKHIPDNIPWLLWELYAEAREVFLVRDFRDVVCSMLAYNSKRGYTAFGRESASSDEEFIKRMRPSAQSLLRSYKNRSERAYLLRYEDIILQPNEALSSLLKYLDLDYSSSTIEGMIRKASEETPGMYHHRTSPDPEKSIGRWRRDLDPSLQAVCQEAFGDILEEFGYAE